MHVESTADTVEDLHGRRLLVTAPRRRRDFLAEYPPRAPRAGGGDSLRCRPSRPGHDGMETGLRHHSKADLSRSGAVRTSLLALPAFMRCRWGLRHEAMGRIGWPLPARPATRR